MPAKRIVSLIASATEMVHALGMGDRMVGRSHECDYPDCVRQLPVCSQTWIDAKAPSAEIDRQVRNRVRRGLSLYDLNARLLYELKPDLIITQVQCDVCAVSPRDVLPVLSQWPGPMPQVLPLNPLCLDHVWQDIERIAEALGVRERGQAVRASIAERIGELEQRCRRTNRPRLVLLEWIDPLMVGGHWNPELIALAGAEDPLGKAGQSAAIVSLNQLCAIDPDFILIAPCGFDLPRTQSEYTQLAHKKEWQGLRAVARGQVALADGNAFFNRPGPRLVQSLAILADFLDGCQGDQHWQRILPI